VANPPQCFQSKKSRERIVAPQNGGGGGPAFKALDLRVPHLSRRSTGGVFEFSSSSETTNQIIERMDSES
jgi:hypothetical protein